MLVWLEPRAHCGEGVSHGGRHWEEVWAVLSEIGHLYGFDQDSGIISFTFLKPRKRGGNRGPIRR